MAPGHQTRCSAAELPPHVRRLGVRPAADSATGARAGALAHRGHGFEFGKAGKHLVFQGDCIPGQGQAQVWQNRSVGYGRLASGGDKTGHIRENLSVFCFEIALVSGIKR